MKLNNKENIKVLKSALQFYNVNEENINMISSHRSYIYEYLKNGEEFILRIQNKSYGNLEYVKSEMDWILFLHRNNVSVSKPILSINNNFVEEINFDPSYIVTSFYKAKGKQISKDELTPKLFQYSGDLIGSLHYATKSYTPSRNIKKRNEWFESSYYFDYQENNIDNIKILAEGKKIIEILSKLEIDKDSYGLIHSDLHPGNFNIFKNELIAYDFEGSEYLWFIFDIATVIFYTYKNLNLSNLDYIDFFNKYFISNYMKKNYLDKKWFEKIPLFLKFREIINYHLYLRMWDLKNLTNNQKIVLSNLEYNIENRIPVFGLSSFKI